MIDKLLADNLHQIGVSEEQFVAACAQGAHSNHPVNKLLFGQILSVDDFLSQCGINRRMTYPFHAGRSYAIDAAKNTTRPSILMGLLC